MFTVRTFHRLGPRSTRTLSSSQSVLSSKRHATNANETPSSHSAGTDTQGDVHSAGKQAAKTGASTGLDSAAQSKGGKPTGESHKATQSAGVGMKDQVGGTGKPGASHVGGEEKA